MDANLIIENLLDRIKVLTKEVAFLTAQLQVIEEQNKAPEEVEPNGE